MGFLFFYTFFKTLCWVQYGYIETFTGDADSFVWFVLTSFCAGLPILGAIIFFGLRKMMKHKYSKL